MVSLNGFRTFMSQLVAVVFFINTTMSLTITSSFTVLMAKAYGAYMCVFQTTNTNVWMILAAAYYFARYAGAQDTYMSYLNMANEYICTCMLDIAFMSQFGVG